MKFHRVRRTPPSAPITRAIDDRCSLDGSVVAAAKIPPVFRKLTVFHVVVQRSRHRTAAARVVRYEGNPRILTGAIGNNIPGPGSD